MKYIKPIITILFFVSLFISLTSMPQAMANTTAAPACLNFVYLPLTIGGNSSGNQTSQQVAKVGANLSPDKPDFNGDGCADLAIGVPQETLDSGGNQGLVQVMYGSSIGVTAEHS